MRSRHEAEYRLVIPEAAKSYIIAALHQELNLPILFISAQLGSAKNLYNQLHVWYSNSSLLQFYPETEFLAGDGFVTDPVAATERLRVLHLFGRVALSNNSKPPLIVSSALAAAGTTVSRNIFVESCYMMEVGTLVDQLQLIERWQDLGYEMENLVEIPGTISRRGGILDIFSPNNELPARIELSGNRIASIRLFDPKTQRSSTVVPSVTIIPANEGGLQSTTTETILDYMPGGSLLIIDDISEIKAVIEKIDGEVKEFQQLKKEHSKPAADTQGVYLPWSEFEEKIEKVKRRVILSPWNLNNTDRIYSLPLSLVPSYGGRLNDFSQSLKEMLKESRRIVIVSQQTARLAEVLQEHDISTLVSQLERVPPLKSVTLVQGSITGGWAIRNVFTLFSDREIFGIVKERRLSSKRPIRHHWFVSELVPGDYIVHVEHGIAKFVGLTKVSDQSAEREYIVLEYAAGDRLYVPTDQVDRVSRYIGSNDQPPALSRLGTQEWARTKQKIKESVAEIARELLDLYAARGVVSGFAFSPDNLWQQELESSFPYVETRDQLEAVKSVKADMEKPRPMDRLVCGDVGYGKTEVALRAAFKAVMDGKQVAMLVPTTILTQQHFATFHARLQSFPIRVEMLSRFCTEKEQDMTIEGLAAGMVDICIGTHRLLQKDIKFKDLGLVIIDEEQRFGVVHKEHFKQLRREVDVLTLSATPIPRTLHMSLVGIRDMSTMETPPEDRLPIKTYVGVYDDRLVREAVLRELERNGQIFFVHNRVSSIFSVASRLEKLIPEARISVAHGRMSEDELEKVMTEFANGSSDVLVTTTIIESGLDMPNVNTLIVDNADKLGLTQLYQLRGRVGRGDDHAHAYFLFDGGKQLTPEARNRLGTIAEATELGAGFGIAMKDLEIRGAGSLLGVAQSGYISAVGFDLYCRLLGEAVEEGREKRAGEVKKRELPVVSTAISLPLAAYIPEEYVSSQSTRVAFYQKLAAVSHPDEIDDIAQELNDRFGAPPQAVGNLLYIIMIRQLATEAAAESVFAGDGQIIICFSSAKKLDKLSLRDAEGVKAGNRQIRLDIENLAGSWQRTLREVLQAVVTGPDGTEANCLNC